LKDFIDIWKEFKSIWGENSGHSECFYKTLLFLSGTIRELQRAGGKSRQYDNLIKSNELQVRDQLIQDFLECISIDFPIASGIVLYIKDILTRMLFGMAY